MDDITPKASEDKNFKQILISVTSYQKDKLELLSDKLGRSQSDLVREALQRLLGSYQDVLEKTT